MNVTSFIEKIVGLQQQRVQTAVATYRELVVTISTGEDPDPAGVERLLDDAGKSLDDLRRDIEHYQRRRSLKAAVAAMPKLESERKTLDEHIAAADRLLESAEEEHHETTRPLYARRREVDQALTQGSTAFAELVYSCDDPALRSELDEFEAELRRLDEQHRSLESRTHQMDRKAREEHHNAEHQMVLADTQRGHDRAKRYEQEAESLRRETKKAAKAKADFEKRREGIERRMRESCI